MHSLKLAQCFTWVFEVPLFLQTMHQMLFVAEACAACLELGDRWAGVALWKEQWLHRGPEVLH